MITSGFLVDYLVRIDDGKERGFNLLSILTIDWFY